MERIAISLPIRLYMHIAYGIWKHRHTKPVVLYILYIHIYIYIYLHTHTHTHTLTHIYIYIHQNEISLCTHQSGWNKTWILTTLDDYKDVKKMGHPYTADGIAKW